MAVEPGKGRGVKRRKKDCIAKLLKGEKVEVRFLDDGLKGSWHSGTIIDCGQCFRLIEYDEMMDEYSASKLVERVSVSTAIDGITCMFSDNYRGNVRPSPPYCAVDRAEVRYGLCVDALVDDAWWEGVVFDHDEASSKRLVFFPDQGDQQVIPVTRLRLTLDWEEVAGDWSPRGCWLFLELLQKFEHEGPLPVSVRQIWYDVRCHSSFSENISDWFFGSWSLWLELVSEVINEILSVSFGLTVPERLVALPFNMEEINSPVKAMSFSVGNNFQLGGAGLGVANKNLELEKVMCDSLPEYAETPGKRIWEHHCTESVSDAPVGSICRTLALAVPERKELKGCGHCPQILSDFIFEHHRRKGPWPPDSKERYVIAREAAKHYLLEAGWKFKCNRSGIKYYISPFEEQYLSFIKACESWEIVERRRLVSCNGRSENIMCNDKYLRDRVQTAHKDEDGYTGYRDAESWQPLDLDAEYCPEAIRHYADGLVGGSNQNEVMGEIDLNHISTVTKVRKHLLSLGWRVETKKSKLRYRSPYGKNFYSLQRACSHLTVECEGRGHKCRDEGSINGDNTGENHRSSITEFHPESTFLDLEPTMSLKKIAEHKKWENHEKNAVELYVAKEYLTYDEKIKATHESLKMVGSNGMVTSTEPSRSLEQGEHVRQNYCQFAKENSNCYASEGECLVHGFLSPDYNPQAIIDYIHYIESRPSNCKKGKYALDDSDDDDVGIMRTKVRKHLLSVGWNFGVRTKQGRKEQCYRSSYGKSFYSLYTACKAYIEGKHFKMVSGRSSIKLTRCKQCKNWSVGDDLSECAENNSELHVCCSSMKRAHDDPQEAVHLSHSTASGSSIFACSSSHYSKLHHSVGRGRGLRKVKDRGLKETPSSSLSLCHRMVKHPSDLRRGNSRSRKRKASQSLFRQPDLSGRKFSRHVLQSSKRPLAILSSPNHHVARTVLSWLIDNNVVLPRQKVRYVRKRDGYVMKEGRITRDGIKCKCCKKVFTLSNFESHAGSSIRRPAANIFLQDGRSLLQCQMQMLCNNKPKEFPHKRRKVDYSSYQNDIICSMCQDGGSLVLCDHCPSSFHLACVGLEEVPEGKWSCPSCRCRICGLSEFNCDSSWFSEETILYCDQCEREYHVGCLKRRRSARLENCPEGNWFCSKSCSEIFLRLRKLLGKINPTALDGFSWTILRSRRESDPDLDAFDMDTITEYHSKLSVSLNVMHECFQTIIEPRTQSDLVADLLFNKESELNRLNFWGFYTMLLQRGDELISVATFRVFGEKVAEVPLVGTRIQYRRKGMCRLLMDELEKLLSMLGVERLLLPAIPQLLETWTTSFGFTKMTNSERLMFSEFTFLNFQDTIMCQKLLRNSHIIAKDLEAGNHDTLLATSNEEVDCDNKSIIYEVVKMVEPIEMIEPIKSLPSLTDGPCATVGGCVSVGKVNSEIDTAHSPCTSYCSNMLGVLQEEEETICSQVTEQRPANVSSGKCSDGYPTIEMVPPSNMVEHASDPERRFTGKCYVRGRTKIDGEFSHSTCARERNKFKYFYKRRILAT